MRVLVTGGAGFIGANVVRRLVTEGAATVVLDDLSSGTWDNLTGVPCVERVEGSVLDRGLLDACLSRADAVVHLAARPSVPATVADPVGTHAHNATGTVLVLDAAVRAGGLHTIVASSAAVYGDDPTPWKHEGLVPRPRSPYAADKLCSESAAMAASACYGLPTLALRFFNVFGPLQPADHAYAAVVPAFVAAALAGRPLTIHGDGCQTRDFVDVDDVTRVIARALSERITSGGPVNLAFGTRRSVLEVADALEGALARPLPRWHTAARPGDVRDSGADPSRFASLFPDLKPAGFERGLERTIAWFEDPATHPAGAAFGYAPDR
jgi:UDP-glucose 4-epimerase